MQTQRTLFFFALLTATAACAASTETGPVDDGTANDGGSTPTLDAGTTRDASPPPSSDGQVPPPPGSDAAPPSGTPSLVMVSGNGATIPAQWQGGDPLRVRALSGASPVASAAVTFTLTQGTSVHVQAPNGVVTTDGDGIAAVTLNAFGIQPWLGWDANVVTASWNGRKVDFAVIVTAVPQSSAPLPPLVQYTTPQGTHDLGTAKAGAILPGAIVALGVLQQGPSQGQALPGWGFRLTDANDPLASSPVACVGGTVLADVKGTIRCDVKVPSAPGSYVFGLMAAGQTKWTDGHLVVE